MLVIIQSFNWRKNLSTLLKLLYSFYIIKSLHRHNASHDSVPFGLAARSTFLRYYDLRIPRQNCAGTLAISFCKSIKLYISAFKNPLKKQKLYTTRQCLPFLAAAVSSLPSMTLFHCRSLPPGSRWRLLSAVQGCTLCKRRCHSRCVPQPRLTNSCLKLSLEQIW